MLRRQNHTRRAVDRIHTRCKHAHLLTRLQLEIHLGAFAPANPVGLHSQHAVRPATLQLFNVLQQFIGIRGDLNEPLRHLLLFHRHRLVPPATAVHHLLVRQHCGALRAPVQQRLFPVRQPLLEHPHEEPLVPLVVLRLARRNLAIPIVGKAHPPVLSLHLLDVVARPFARLPVVLNRRVLRRQPKRIPAHRVQHVEPAHPLITRQRVPNRIVPHMPDMQRARRIRQHLQHIELRLRRVLFRRKQLRVSRPAFAPLRFNFLMAINLFGHDGLVN